MRRQRDSQRSKVYRAEAVLSRHASKFNGLSQIERFVEKVQRSERVRGEFEELVRHPIGVERSRGYGSKAWASKILISKWQESDWIVLHELAHVQVRRSHGSTVAGHGHEYCAVYLKLVLWFIGREAHDDLKASFKANRVRFTPPRKVQMSPEARAAAAARLRKYREGG